jgi:hypothetical protein
MPHHPRPARLPAALRRQSPARGRTQRPARRYPLVDGKHALASPEASAVVASFICSSLLFASLEFGTWARACFAPHEAHRLATRRGRGERGARARRPRPLSSIRAHPASDGSEPTTDAATRADPLVESRRCCAGRERLPLSKTLTDRAPFAGTPTDEVHGELAGWVLSIPFLARPAAAIVDGRRCVRSRTCGSRRSWSRSWCSTRPDV